MRVESLDIGASGLVRLRTDGGSRFIFRLEHLDTSFQSLPGLGEELGEAFLAAVNTASAVYTAEQKALELLARSEHTRFLLTLKLRKRDIPDETIRAALDRLERDRLLDDQRYARAWAEERFRKRGEGPARIVSGLISRGIGGELAKRVTNELFEGSGRAEALERSLRRLMRSGRASEEKVVRRLRAEGWKPSELSVALESFRNGSE